jgi:predicted subunit of tRNA(5-methylaminomethyl-2-thiouridylate) methyltransferase
MSGQLKENGLLLLHLGVTKNRNMAEEIAELITHEFRVISIVQEDVAKNESHGLTDKGKKTTEHAYLFARRI